MFRLPIILFLGIDLLTAAVIAGESAAASGNGKQIYEYYCYQCHGYDGTAKTQAGLYLDPRPRDFSITSPQALSRAAMLHTVRNGRPGTAMVGFARVLNTGQMEAVVDYIRQQLMVTNPRPGRYHTEANGWPDHERYIAAYPFATGELSLATPWAELNETQRAGRKLFLTACITCHDPGGSHASAPIWQLRAVSFPRNPYSQQTDIDALSGASVYARHEQPTPEQGLDERERQGRRLYLQNCAFCHAPDGSARNWIGSFLEPHPRDFTAAGFIDDRTDEQLQQVIDKGLPGTSMPAWGQVLAPDQIEAVISYLRRAFGSNREMTPSPPDVK